MMRDDVTEYEARFLKTLPKKPEQLPPQMVQDFLFNGFAVRGRPEKPLLDDYLIITERGIRAMDKHVITFLIEDLER